jgi:hypothetical protein
MKSSPHLFSRTLAVAALTASGASAVHSLEVTAGDYEIYPAGANIGLLYYQHAERSDLYVGGNKVSSNFKLTSDVGLARYIRPIKVNDTTTVDFNAILPFGRLKGSGDAAVLGSTSGTADLIVGAATKFLVDAATKDAFSVGTFVYLPTGSYDNDQPLNLGENRWKALLQLAYVAHFGAAWALDTVGDVLVHGKNDEAGAAESVLKQRPRYEVQAHLRYIPSAATALSVGLGRYWGAESKVNGLAQDDRLKTTYARLTATHWLTQTVQLQAQLGRDVSVANGPKEKSRLNLRVGTIF